MAVREFTYVVVGAGVTGGWAVKGIRERDEKGSILLIGAERHLPYDRPPLSKDLWFRRKRLEEIWVNKQRYYDREGVEVLLGTKVVGVNARQRTLTDETGTSYAFQKLLLATGAIPRHLPVPGSDLDGVIYYRYLDDYLRLRNETVAGKSVVVIGGGFIGSEMAAALIANDAAVTMIFPASYLVQRVFPDYLGRAIQDDYVRRGIRIIQGDKPSVISRSGRRYEINTENGDHVLSDLVVVGIGVAPAVDLAKDAGLEVDNGIVVNEFLQTSHPDIYAAGDNACFPYPALGRSMRVEHWDNALSQGKWAGRNMAGAGEPFTYMPYFYSDLFEYSYEAVGDVDARLETYADWQKENDTGVIYYLQDGRVRGAMLCKVWGKLDAARELIQQGERMAPDDLRGAIH